jgi:hypothetical protein
MPDTEKQKKQEAQRQALSQSAKTDQQEIFKKMRRWLWCLWGSQLTGVGLILIGLLVIVFNKGSILDWKLTIACVGAVGFGLLIIVGVTVPCAKMAQGYRVSSLVIHRVRMELGRGAEEGESEAAILSARCVMLALLPSYADPRPFSDLRDLFSRVGAEKV